MLLDGIGIDDVVILLRAGQAGHHPKWVMTLPVGRGLIALCKV
jgi:hypothetical protein